MSRPGRGWIGGCGVLRSQQQLTTYWRRTPAALPLRLAGRFVVPGTRHEAGVPQLDALATRPPASADAQRGVMNRRRGRPAPLALLLLLLGAATGVRGIKITVAPGRTDCFTETITPEVFSVRTAR
eukprot:360271-Chlamydomonas_euryale.AAC.3